MNSVNPYIEFGDKKKSSGRQYILCDTMDMSYKGYNIHLNQDELVLYFETCGQLFDTFDEAINYIEEMLA